VKTPLKEPTAAPAASRAALVLGLVLIALAVVLVRDLAAAEGWTSGTPWTVQLAEDLDGLTASTGLAVLGAVLAVVGLLVALSALLPARRTHVPLDDAPDTWITPAAVAALAQGVADRSAGVLAARTEKVSRRSVRIAVTAASDAGSVAQAAQRDVDSALRGLTSPSVRVRGTAEVAS
jgi:hypothetical protein